MKYVKPKLQGISDLTTAQGLCISGLAVGKCDPNGLTAGTCGTSGFTAGICGPTGGTVYNTDCSASGGVAVNCIANGIGASQSG
jgi:hypothetical protein